MIIGVPKEIKNHEYRVGIIPSGVKALTQDGHRVLIEKGAGLGSGISDEDFEKAGATLVDTAQEVFGESDMIIKVKEPLEAEYPLLKRGQIIYTYFHLAAFPELAEVLLNKEIVAIGYETIQEDDGTLPLLRPMSEIAGKMAVQVGARYLEKEYGGKGVLLGGVPGVRRGKVVIIGAGTVGINATKIAVGMGARVTVLDINVRRLTYLDDIFSSKVDVLMSDHHNILESIKDCDLLIGAVLIAGARAPVVVTEDMVKSMEENSVIVDVSVDQGGCIQTCKPTTHENPVYKKHGIIHYCVANIPGAVARTSTYALTNCTITYARKIANDPVGVLKSNLPIRRGVNTYGGYITHPAVAKSLDLPYKSLDEMIS